MAKRKDAGRPAEIKTPKNVCTSKVLSYVTDKGSRNLALKCAFDYLNAVKPSCFPKLRIINNGSCGPTSRLEVTLEDCENNKSAFITITNSVISDSKNKIKMDNKDERYIVDLLPFYPTKDFEIRININRELMGDHNSIIQICDKYIFQYESQDTIEGKYDECLDKDSIIVDSGFLNSTLNEIYTTQNIFEILLAHLKELKEAGYDILPAEYGDFANRLRYLSGMWDYVDFQYDYNYGMGSSKSIGSAYCIVNPRYAFVWYLFESLGYYNSYNADYEKESNNLIYTFIDNVIMSIQHVYDSEIKVKSLPEIEAMIDKHLDCQNERYLSHYLFSIIIRELILNAQLSSRYTFWFDSENKDPVTGNPLIVDIPNMEKKFDLSLWLNMNIPIDIFNTENEISNCFNTIKYVERILRDDKKSISFKENVCHDMVGIFKTQEQYFIGLSFLVVTHLINFFSMMHGSAFEISRNANNFIGNMRAKCTVDERSIFLYSFKSAYERTNRLSPTLNAGYESDSTFINLLKMSTKFLSFLKKHFKFYHVIACIDKIDNGTQFGEIGDSYIVYLDRYYKPAGEIEVAITSSIGDVRVIYPK